MEDKGKETGKGRGAALLKLAKEKRPGDSAVKSSSESPSQTQHNVPLYYPTEMPSSSTTGHGRGSLLSTLRSMQYASASTSKQVEVTSPDRELSIDESADTSGQVICVKGVLGELTEITLEELKTLATPTSELKQQTRRGTGGSSVQLSGNYISLNLSPGRELFSYEVKFNPDIESRPLRRKLLNQHLQAFGQTKVFDGVTLYLPQKLEQDITILESIHPMNQSKVYLKVIYKKEQTMSENIPFFNVLLGRVLRSLNLVRIGQHNFNPKRIHPIPQHKLEVWPGYATAISAYEGGLKLCIDARHRVMRTETIRDIMLNLKNEWNFKEAVARELVGLSVFTRYNNRTYRVDDVAWDKNPTHEFVKGTEKVTFINYYKLHWNIKIKDESQPLLVHCNKHKSSIGEPNLYHWSILYCQKDTRCTREFVGMFKNVTRVMGMDVRDPRMICLRDDRIETYVEALRKSIQQTANLMIIVFPTNRTDRYSAVKRVCCVEMPIASQVIMSRTISRGDKLKSITEKIALQVNCKLGGALWALAIPMDNCMICGIDVYHAGSGQSKESVAGFVASLDKPLTTWHSKICIQGKRQEIVDMLQMCLISALKAYHRHNKCYPDRIIIYRDGVSDGQLQIVVKYEIKQLLASFKSIEINYEPTLTVIIVQKRINTRIFDRSCLELRNPSPGTVVDWYITKPDVYDFFLVSQNIRQGTVSPTRYIVIYDSRNMRPEHIQRLTYKLCYLYYNWPGTIKVPAPCQYAHKLVSLVGQNLQLEPHTSLADTLYYL